MPSIVYYENNPLSRGKGVWIRSTEINDVDNFINRQFPILAEKCNVKFWRVSVVADKSPVFLVFMEFYPNTADDSILKLMQQFNQFYGKEYSFGELLMEIPSIQLLRSLKLL